MDKGTSDMDDDDSEVLELISQGQSDHPLVKYTRLLQDKKAELEYKYNPVCREYLFFIKTYYLTILF